MLRNPHRTFWSGSVPVQPAPTVAPISTATVSQDINVKRFVSTPESKPIPDIAERLKPYLLKPKPNQEFNLVIEEDNFRLMFRVETHKGLNKVFEGINRTDLIRHANIQMQQYIDGKWQYITVPGTDTENYHLFLNQILQKYGF